MDIKDYGERLKPNALASANDHDGAEHTILRCPALLDDDTPAVLGRPSIRPTWPTPMMVPTEEGPHVPVVVASELPGKLPRVIPKA